MLAKPFKKKSQVGVPIWLFFLAVVGPEVSGTNGRSRLKLAFVGVRPDMHKLLLGEEIKIKQILNTESNKETEDNKYNWVDILLENSKGELVIIEVQNSKKYDYFHRMLFRAT